MNAPMDKNTQPRLTPASTTPASAVARTAAPQAAQERPPGAPDVGALIRRVFAHWPIVIVAMVLGAFITAQVVTRRKALYKSETVIFYREGIGRSVTGPTEGADVLRTLGTKLKETLLAQQNLRKIIDEQHLYKEIVAKSGYADAVDQMRKKTEFKSRSQDTFAISFEGTTREEAQKVCARMAELLVAEHQKRMTDDMKGTREFLEIEKKRADDELERVEKEVSEFLAAHPEFAGAKDALGTESLSEQKKAQEEELKRSRKAATKGRLARRGDAAPGAPAGAGAGERPAAVDPVLLATKTQATTDLINARKELADKSLKFTEQHPDVRAAEAKVAAALEALRRAEEAIASAQPAEAPAPARKPVALDDPYAESSASARVAPAPGAPIAAERDDPKPKPKDPDSENKNVSLEMEWSRLSRMVALARARQGDLETKLYRAEMVANTAESGYGTTMAVLDPAYKPSGPSNAPNKIVLMMGLGASLAVGLVLTAAWGLFLDDRLFSAGEIEGVVMVPVLGVVPRSKKKDKEKGKRWLGLVRG
jgi:uncharacterized protein involved in exopolysaccharide biosynthesis